jgi:ubiquitin C-terminal hydrolase
MPSAFLLNEQSLPDWLRGGQQQDASEFGRYLMDELDTQAKKLGEGSIVADEFGGTTATIIRCCTCGRQSIREEDFVDLVLSFPYQKDEGPVLELENMLEHFSSPEKLIGSVPFCLKWRSSYLQYDSGDNQYRCDSCGDLREAERRTAITKPPKHLILSLNRFSFDYTSQRRNKILQEVRSCEILCNVFDFSDLVLCRSATKSGLLLW